MAVDSWKNADSSQERSAKRTEKKGSWGEKSQVNEVSPCLAYKTVRIIFIVILLYYSQNKRSSIFFTKGDSLDIRQCLNISIQETTFSRTNFHNFPNSSQQTTGILGVSKRIVEKGERESWDSRDMTGNLGSQNLTLSTKNSRSSGQKNDKSILVMKFVDFYPSRNRNLKRSIGNVIFYFF